MIELQDGECYWLKCAHDPRTVFLVGSFRVEVSGFRCFDICGGGIMVDADEFEVISHIPKPKPDIDPKIGEFYWMRADGQLNVGVCGATSDGEKVMSVCGDGSSHLLRHVEIIAQIPKPEDE